ncbi:medium-chain acyl-CoA ligase ACSF2, mitochondrial-like [Bacillus rossius redtenbacheri]|uniref:medium-chain acyl-CoA ligase ACSF2, mitochondrial-like n=1 Tax=Bacillus rossius redtenbacheri TaxID=93214 RepID=UPI002FDE45EB
MDYYTRCARVKPSYWHEPQGSRCLPITVGQLAEWAAEEWGDREALVSVHQGIRWSFKEAKEKADELAAGLIALGLKMGDRVAIWGYSSSYHYLAALAAPRAGLILAKVDPSNRASELCHCLNTVGARALLAAETDVSQDYYQIIHSLAPELSYCEAGRLRSEKLPELTTVILTGDQPPPGAYHIDEILAMATPEALEEVKNMQSTIQPDQGAFIHYTSGTTGTPKGALWSHHNVVNASYIYGKVLGFNDGVHRLLAQMQSCHIGTSMTAFASGLHFGCTTVFAAAKFDPRSSLEALLAERCTFSLGTPVMYIDMIAALRELSLTMSYPRCAIVGGTTIPETLARGIIDAFQLDRFIPVYGMTEGVPFFVSSKEDTLEQSISTMGRAVEGFEFKVVDEGGKMVPMGTPGELWVRGFCVMQGYWRNEEKTKETITEHGWLRTGDQVMLSEDGYGQIVGRIKDMVIRGGDNIFPKEIEDFYLTHPEVADVQAFGVPDPRWGEEVCVYIRPIDKADLSEKDMKEFCVGKVADFRIPRYIRFMQDFPRSMTGKVNKRKMREEFLKDPEFLETQQSADN